MTPIPFDSGAVVRGLYSILPELVVIATAIAVRWPTSLPERGKKPWPPRIAGIAVAILSALSLGPGGSTGFLRNDPARRGGLFVTLVVLATALLTLLMATGYSSGGDQKGSFYALLLFSTAGSLHGEGDGSHDRLPRLETMSIPIYCLAGSTGTR